MPASTSIVEVFAVEREPESDSALLSLSESPLVHLIGVNATPAEPEATAVEREAGCDQVIPQSKATSDTPKRVLTSENILPVILLEVKSALRNMPPAGPLDDSSGSVAESRINSKVSFPSFLRVNRSFFHAGTNLLWSTMETLAPVFKLLPWFTKGRCTGFGRYQYNGSVDWARFNFYASRIQRFHLKHSPEEDFSISPAWILQLLSLHERPDPLFPTLQSITVTPKAPPGLRVLFLLLGPSLLSLELYPCSELRDYVKIPSDWEAYAGESDEAQAYREKELEHLIAVFPKVFVSCPKLQSFTYRGPFTTDLFDHVSQLTGLVSMHLTLANSYGKLLAPSECFAKLTSLRHLVLEAPLLDVGHSLASHVTANLETLKIATTASQQMRFRESIRFNNLRKLVLEFIGETPDASFYSTIRSYLAQSAGLENLTITFFVTSIEIPRVQEESKMVESSEAPGGRTQGYTSMHALAFSTIRRAENLKHVHLLNVPLSLTEYAIHMFRIAMFGWPDLTTLVFRIQQQDPISPRPNHATGTSEAFYGLSLLGRISKSCSKLQELEFHFDETKIATEQLNSETEPLKPFSPTTRERLSEIGAHPLRVLRINTTGNSSTSPKWDLDLGRKIEIGRFLVRLFPQLDALQGSASSVWEEIGILVRSYRAVRENAYARIEALRRLQ